MRQLTTKQEAFKEAVVSGEKPIDAARIAKYRGNDVTLSAVAYENLRKPRIKAAIELRRAELREITGWTIEVSQSKLLHAYDVAEKHHQPSAMVSAAIAVNRLHNLDQPSDRTDQDALSKRMQALADEIADRHYNGPQLAQDGDMPKTGTEA